MNIKRKLVIAAYHAARACGLITMQSERHPYASILMFHRVNDYDSDCLSVRVKVFEEMLQMFRNEYNVISLSALIEALTTGQKIKKGSIVITFDDGYRDNFLFAAPLLAKYGLPATFFVVSDYIGSNRVFPWDLDNPTHNPPMNWDEIRELSRMGFEIGGHTSNHLNLRNASIEEAQREIVESKKKIEDEIGQKITLFSYPFGGKDDMRDEIYPIIREAGFTCCCSGYGGKVTSKTDIFKLNRVVVHQSAIEMRMEIDNFLSYMDGRMRFSPNNY
jgi:peptidoglycan/xylan/chitin deacetylase (PgdA/CDA1 family)